MGIGFPFTLFGLFFLIWVMHSDAFYPWFATRVDIAVCKRSLPDTHTEVIPAGGYFLETIDTDSFLLVRFDVFSDVNHDASLLNHSVTILKAELHYTSSGSDTICIYNVTQDWNVENVTYNSFGELMDGDNISDEPIEDLDYFNGIADVTDSIQALQQGDKHYGWVFTSDTSDALSSVKLKVRWCLGASCNYWPASPVSPTATPTRPPTASPTNPPTPLPTSSPTVMTTEAPSIEATSAPTLPILPQCEWQRDHCTCESGIYVCTGVLTGTILLPKEQMIWKTPISISNDSTIVFRENSSMILENCHNINGKMIVDFAPTTESTHTLAEVNDKDCKLQDVPINFAKDTKCIKGSTEQRDNKLVAVFSNECESNPLVIPLVVTVVVVIGAALLICAVIMLYEPARAKVFPFHLRDEKMAPMNNYVTTVHSVAVAK